MNDDIVRRRDVLETIGAGIALGAVGLPVLSRPAAASGHGDETLYLTDSGGENSGDVLAKLYEVGLMAATDDTGPRAELSLVYELTDNDVGQVDAIAASLDGSAVYAVDKTS
jgi:hypothetical protein